MAPNFPFLMQIHQKIRISMAVLQAKNALKREIYSYVRLFWFLLQILQFHLLGQMET